MAHAEDEALTPVNSDRLGRQPEGYRLFELAPFLRNLINKNGNK
jgi:hypothetical protein